MSSFVLVPRLAISDGVGGDISVIVFQNSATNQTSPEVNYFLNETLTTTVYVKMFREFIIDKLNHNNFKFKIIEMKQNILR